MQRVYMTLSAKKDPDLVALRETVGGRMFAYLVKDALRSVTRSGYKPLHSLPPGTILSPPKAECVTFVLTFSSRKDADIEKLLSYVKKGCTAHFIREALRFSIGTLLLQSYMNDEFTDVIRSCAVPTPQHIYQIGSSVFVPTKKPRNQKKASTPSVTSVPVRKTETQNVLAMNAAIETEVPEIRSLFQPEKEPEEVPCTTNTNDEDDILAMLSAMLS